MQLCLVGRLLPGDSRRVRVKKDGRQGEREKAACDYNTVG